MNAVLTLALKDLLLLWRDRASLFWMFGLPFVFAAFFGAVFGGGGPGGSNPLQVAVVEEGLTDAGRRLVERIDESDAIAVDYLPRPAAEDAVRRGHKLAWLEIVRAPADDFAMFAGESPSLRMGIDPSRQAEKGLLQGLVMEAVFKGFRDLMTDPARAREELDRMMERLDADGELPALQKIALKTFFSAFDSFLATPGLMDGGGDAVLSPQLDVVGVTRERSGPPNAYSVSFPQSILWGILGCAAGFALTLVRERTKGTMVRLLTAPISHGQVMAGKVLACMVSCLAVVLVLTAAGAVVFGLEVGSVAMLALAGLAAAFCFAGVTMLLGSLARTEQGVSGLAWGILLVCAMLGGGMVPQFVMPGWMLDAGAVSPARWAIGAFEGAIWRDFSLAEMALPCGLLAAIGLAALWLGAARLKRAR